MAQRRRRKLTEKAAPDEAGYLPTDGERISVSHVDLNPDDDDFLELAQLGQPQFHPDSEGGEHVNEA